MSLSLGTRTAIGLTIRGFAARWRVLALAFALLWLTAPTSGGSRLGEVTATLAGVTSALAEAASSAALDVHLPQHDRSVLSTDETSDDLMGSPRSAELAEYGTSVGAIIAQVAPCAAFLRLFNPRAPPRTA